MTIQIVLCPSSKHSLPSPQQVPITLYFMTHAYFALYHALANVLIRKARNVAKPWGPRAQLAAEIFVVFTLSYSTAFMETLTIAHFPYYTHKVRDYWLKGVGRIPVATRACSSLPERAPAPLHPPSEFHQPQPPFFCAEQSADVHGRQPVLRDLLFRVLSHVFPHGRGPAPGGLGMRGWCMPLWYCMPVK